MLSNQVCFWWRFFGLLFSVIIYIHVAYKWYQFSLHTKWYKKISSIKRGQLDIPKGHNSEWFLFQKVLFRGVIIPKFFFLISKGHYSEDFYPERPLFWNNDPLG